ncbi:aspartate dehydrogenase domain-containing protein-like isoform X2 [Palaemon carinicauda]|uniref:aspartate dehydrogenase domain-containing protein-like isoform X2 n=1 Tax=Palaemon carinicauda TaxID=392227 RepID=UPI0035B5C0C3
MVTKRIGIVGFGHLGKYLTNAVLDRPDLELAFVWNRTSSLIEEVIESRYICHDLEECGQFNPDLIVEVAHPAISEKYGQHFLQVADYLVGSPTALASQHVEDALRKAATSHGLYIPAGAFWGGEDISKMADRGTLKALKVTMKKHPSCFKLEGTLKAKNENIQGSEAVVLYDGPVRDLCPLAPNNVNTMAAAAMAAHNLGFNGVKGCLISDPKLTDWHVVEVDVTGPEVAGKDFNVKTVRNNPAAPGAVTGTATYASFLSSMVRAGGKGPGVHLC